MPLNGERLRALRQKLGYTQEELAERLSLGPRQIPRYENGETDPAGDIVARLARELETTTDYLLGISDLPQPPISKNDLSPDEAKLVAAFRAGHIKKALKLLASGEEESDESIVAPRKPAANS